MRCVPFRPGLSLRSDRGALCVPEESTRRWSAVLSNTIKDAATFSVLTCWTGEAVAVRRTVPPVMQLDGTGLPIFGSTPDTRLVGIGIGAAAAAGTVQGLDVVVDR